MTPFVWIMGFVVCERLGELWLSRRNTGTLLAQGAREVGARHYPLFILLHASWLIALLVATPLTTPPSWPLLLVFIMLQLMRVWVILSLGSAWTTRIITRDDATLVRRGPYRFLRHPNYVVVVGEIAVLPLAFGAWQIALIWSIMNAMLLSYRIRVENAALAPRLSA